MKRPDISIILPCYNSECCINNSILSIINQSLKELEIIIIDDCSKDSTAEIIRKYMSLDNRIKLIKNHINRGRSYSRNAGILVAKGKYIAFCDSDDFVPTDSYHKLLTSALQNDADIVRGGYQIINNSKINDVRFGKTNSQNLHNNPIHTSLLGVFTSVIYKKKLIDNFRIKFPEDMHVGEDNVFLSNCISKAFRINTINDITYIYNQNDSGTMCRRWKKNDFKSYLRMYEKIKELWPPEAYAIFISRNIQFFINIIFKKIVESLCYEDQLKLVKKMLETIELESSMMFKTSLMNLTKLPNYILDSYRLLKNEDIRSAYKIIANLS